MATAGDSTYDAPLAEALYGVSRVRKAHEGLVRIIFNRC